MDYKEKLRNGYNTYLNDHKIVPNAVFVHIKMRNEKGFDTPYFNGYILIIPKNQRIDYVMNGTLPNGVEDRDILYFCSDIEEVISDIENNHTEFTIEEVDEFENLIYNL